MESDECAGLLEGMSDEGKNQDRARGGHSYNIMEMGLLGIWSVGTRLGGRELRVRAEIERLTKSVRFALHDQPLTR
jgi:hypothetical protein